LQNLAADLGPGQTGRQTDFALCCDSLLPKLDWPEHLLHASSVYNILEIVCYVF
jgi:hypothetical protein